MKHNMSLDENFYGSVTVGERGQIVIPSEARKKFSINPGDKMLVLGHPTANGVWICKIESMREIITSMMDDLDRLTQIAEEQNNTEE